MHISDECLAAFNTPSPVQRDDIARQLEAHSPRTGNAASLLPPTPPGQSRIFIWP
jgi:hypothetical protein